MRLANGAGSSQVPMSKVGRNDPCPCGSRKKFKRCCLGRIEEQERPERIRGEQERMAAEIERLEMVRKRAEARLAEAQAVFGCVRRDRSALGRRASVD